MSNTKKIKLNVATSSIPSAGPSATLHVPDRLTAQGTEGLHIIRQVSAATKRTQPRPAVPIVPVNDGRRRFESSIPNSISKNTKANDKELTYSNITQKNIKPTQRTSYRLTLDDNAPQMFYKQDIQSLVDAFQKIKQNKYYIFTFRLVYHLIFV